MIPTALANSTATPSSKNHNQETKPHPSLTQDVSAKRNTRPKQPGSFEAQSFASTSNTHSSSHCTLPPRPDPFLLHGPHTDFAQLIRDNDNRTFVLAALVRANNQLSAAVEDLSLQNPKIRMMFGSRPRSGHAPLRVAAQGTSCQT